MEFGTHCTYKYFSCVRKRSGATVPHNMPKNVSGKILFSDIRSRSVSPRVYLGILQWRAHAQAINIQI